MAPKAKAKAKRKATAKALGKAHAKGKAQGKAKGKAQGKAQDKAVAKAKAATLAIADGSGSAGWAQLQPGQPMGQLGAQAVKDHLQKLKRQGNPAPVAHYESLKGHKAKLDFALALKLDREASFLTAQESHKAGILEEERIGE